MSWNRDEVDQTDGMAMYVGDLLSYREEDRTFILDDRGSFNQ